MKAESFFQELKRLILSQPKVQNYILSSENCEYGDKIITSKNLFNSFDCVSCNDSSDIYDSYMCVNSYDCDYDVESELCYECNDTYKGYDSSFLDNCANIRNSDYCYACFGCHDLFGCTHLVNKSFCIFNRQLSEEEYKRKVKELKKLPSDHILKMLDDLKLKYPVTQTNEGHNVNAEYGDYIFYNKNCYLCFDAARNEDCSYLYDSFYNIRVSDSTYASHNELTYEVVDSSYLFNCSYTVYSSNCGDCSYIFNCIDLKDSIGCVGLRHKRYCILNRQFNEDMYKQVSEELLNELKSKNLGWDGLIF